jgi:hypothetical protein
VELVFLPNKLEQETALWLSTVTKTVLDLERTKLCETTTAPAFNNHWEFPPASPRRQQLAFYQVYAIKSRETETAAAELRPLLPVLLLLSTTTNGMQPPEFQFMP